jgi:hypothetical protein
VTVQPGARPGEATYCPVSGVVFHPGDRGAQRTVGGRTLYFCCTACAEFFDAHRAAVAAARHLD